MDGKMYNVYVNIVYDRENFLQNIAKISTNHLIWWGVLCSEKNMLSSYVLAWLGKHLSI